MTQRRNGFPTITKNIPAELQLDVDLVSSILNRFPGPELDTVMHRRYLIDKADNFPRWEAIRESELTGTEFKFSKKKKETNE